MTPHVPYVSVRAKSDCTYGAYGLTGVPETYYLDSKDRIVADSIGGVSRQDLEQQLAKVLTPKLGTQFGYGQTRSR